MADLTSTAPQALMPADRDSPDAEIAPGSVSEAAASPVPATLDVETFLAQLDPEVLKRHPTWQRIIDGTVGAKLQRERERIYQQAQADMEAVRQEGERRQQIREMDDETRGRYARVVDEEGEQQLAAATLVQRQAQDEMLSDLPESVQQEIKDKIGRREVNNYRELRDEVKRHMDTDLETRIAARVAEQIAEARKSWEQQYLADGRRGAPPAETGGGRPAGTHQQDDEAFLVAYMNGDTSDHARAQKILQAQT